MTEKPRTDKVIVLGIDGLDSRTANRLVNEGKMPNLKKYLERGSAHKGIKLLGSVPTITPPCWTTLATGAYPGTHGITCYWRQAPESLDAVVYNMDSRNCKAEPIWNETTKNGKKTMVWHWPGCSWPPTSKSPLLSVVDGTQPGSVNMGVAQMDWEKIIYANADIEKDHFTGHTDKAAGVGCNITDLSEVLKNPSSEASDEEDEMMELWWGDKSREGNEIRTYIKTLDDTEMMIGAKVAYDQFFTGIKPAEGWANAPEGALEFHFVVSGGTEERIALITKGANGDYDAVALYHTKDDAEPFAVIPKGKMVSGIIDDVTKKGATKPSCRSYKILELSPDGKNLRFWISNALDTTNSMLWSDNDLFHDIIKNVGPIPPVSLIGGEDAELVREVFIPSWDIYCQWQADCLEYLLQHKQFDAIFSHLHNVDCAGHQLWHLGKTLEPWKNTDEKVYQGFIERVFQQTDDYIGRFLHFLDEGYTIFVVSDHGLLVGENVPPILGEYGGLNVSVMEQLGYTTLKTDADGNKIDEVDWDKTTAVQIRSNYIYINVKGRDKHGIVDPKDKYDLEEQVINDLYNYRDPATGKRVVGLAVRNKDAVVFGTNGDEAGDIFFTVNEGFNRLHGDGLSTAEGYFGTSVTPTFVAAGPGIKANYTTKRVIRQVDVAPTIATLLGTHVPEQCEGAPIYQILTDND
ncbi:alkaline phosphatase family protein [Secundilactobacillus similis DSM 23365 = JCM 2765]|jgi:predicted AlkP superfamily phosphohydrolase/phosphomutase|uniref:Type I phosphodiesterase nucleotide pyrophosphatase n=1 Tax=Secundilactobacillus similis DSM 23365 = JCM 2765 TaxID=1423804 RepID=A0A0R2FPA5_9LACO|nr:alkaline phosphatase family protein [Secundilactobacillus similis]KRN26413.1 type I phosphodiesterase nucleotide pyrophosphatase [Secundilactobacillus similis DSM 23365 = JCM 2765]